MTWKVSSAVADPPGMAGIIILGAGVGGLSTAMLLARDGHEITVLERDPAGPPPPARAWDSWERRGVNQFRLAHFMLPRWYAQIAADLPDVPAELRAAGALSTNTLAMLPEALRGPLRPDDGRFDTVTARRPVLEAVLATVAARTPGVTIRRGVTVTGLWSDPDQRSGPPHVTGVLVEGGRAVRGDLVVDCGGRRSALGAWLDAVGARRPVEEREESGFVYYGRHFRGAPPEPRMYVAQHHDSLTVLTLPADNGTWSVVLATSKRDAALRALRDPHAFDAALARYPLAAHWRDGEPISGVEVMAGIEDRYRRLAVDGEPVATGVVAVGDAWACTNPTLGRGTSIGLLHARVLRDVLREVDPQDHDKLARRVDEQTTALVEPLHRMTVWYDRHRLAEIDADIAGVGYHTDDERWAISKATFAASLADPAIARGYQSLASLLTTPADLYAEPGMLDRIVELGMRAPRYPLPGPDRRELLAAVG
ncbi:hydroxylase [Virgisporangium aurantiacum]|uniref:Hydroxylase n=2 Tax=Virgisporangium aurantiacum TaxID=175570 RepID=A0A8J3ZAM0_9ACTN|nr:hydroxylase [Virgisporangium aurantiacum]